MKTTLRIRLCSANGKVVIGGAFTTVAGVTRKRIARLDPTGSLDFNFVADVTDNTQPTDDSVVHSLLVQPNGGILVGGFFTHIRDVFLNMDVGRKNVARLNPSGTVDSQLRAGSLETASGFGPDNAVRSFAVQANNRIILGGDFT